MGTPRFTPAFKERAVRQVIGCLFESLDKVFFQNLCCPLAELCTTLRTDSVTNSQNCLKIIMIDFTRNLASTFQSNYPEFPDGCVLYKFFFTVEIDQVLIDGTNIFIIELCHRSLRKPQCIGLKTALNAGLTVSTGEEHKLALRGLEYVIPDSNLANICSRPVFIFQL